jgi:hypothetical protein
MRDERAVWVMFCMALRPFAAAVPGNTPPLPNRSQRTRSRF